MVRVRTMHGVLKCINDMVRVRSTAISTVIPRGYIIVHLMYSNKQKMYFVYTIYNKPLHKHLQQNLFICTTITHANMAAILPLF